MTRAVLKLRSEYEESSVGSCRRIHFVRDLVTVGNTSQRVPCDDELFESKSLFNTSDVVEEQKGQVEDTGEKETCNKSRLI